MSIKIGVIADVHGNSAALLAAFNEMAQDSEISHIYCIGDMIGIGYETNEVLELLFSRNDVSCVLGNHEEEILAIKHGKDSSSKGGEKLHHQWLADRLDAKYIPDLIALPKELIIEHEGKTLLFTHYHLTAEKQFAAIDAEPSVEKLDGIYKDSTVDLVCFGHHHPTHYFRSKNRIYVNPGSIGCYDKPIARYAVILVTTEDIQVEFKNAPYDNRGFLRGYEMQAVPEKDFILSVFHGSQQVN